MSAGAYDDLRNPTEPAGAATAFMSAGAYDDPHNPLNGEELVVRVHHTIEAARASAKNERLQSSTTSPDIGKG